MNAVENIILNKTDSIRQAIQIIDAGEMKIALVVDKDRKLIATVADGDVRRGILQGIGLDEPVKRIMHCDFIYIKLGTSRESIIHIAKINKIYQIPVLDENLTLVGIEEVGELLRNRKYSNKVVLMVGGLGTRLQPLTYKTPKSLLKVGDKPILEIILDGFIKYGFKDFIFSVNYKSEMIEEYFGDGSKFGASIQYVHESKRMGTAGSLSYIKDHLTEDFFIMNGDLLTSINFEHLINFHNKTGSQATMCVREYDFQVPYGVVKVKNNNIMSIEEKPINKFFVNAGIYVLNPCVLKYIPEDSFFDMPSLFDILIQNGEKPFSFPIREYWLDIGGVNEYNKANDEYSQHFETST